MVCRAFGSWRHQCAAYSTFLSKWGSGTRKEFLKLREDSPYSRANMWRTHLRAAEQSPPLAIGSVRRGKSLTIIRGFAYAGDML